MTTDAIIGSERRRLPDDQSRVLQAHATVWTSGGLDAAAAATGLQADAVRRALEQLSLDLSP